METRYPKYRIMQWVDTSKAAMNKPQATIFYGVQIKPMKDSLWMHCRRHSKSLIFDKPEKAKAMIAKLKLMPIHTTSGSVNHESNFGI